MAWVSDTDTPEPEHIFRLSKTGGILACDHLAVYIGFCPVDVADVLGEGGTGPPVDLERPVSVAQFCLGADDPGVVVAENTGVFLVSGRIGADLAQIQVVFRIGRL